MGRNFKMFELGEVRRERESSLPTADSERVLLNK